MKQFLLYFSLLILVVSCNNSGEEVKPENTDPKQGNNHQSQPGDVKEIETLFDETEFKDPKHLTLLKELDICALEKRDDCPFCAVCSPEFFKVFEIKPGADINNTFALQIKALTILRGQEFALPVRHLMVFEREGDNLVKVNGFRGNLIQQITSKSGYDDLMIRFYLPDDEAFFNCLFRWSTEEKKYNYISVEVIEGKNWGGPVKEEFKEETSKDVYTSLMMNNMIL